MSRDSSLEELEVLPEEEAGAGDEDREKEILMERIQSIKEEKQVSLHPSPSAWPLSPHPQTVGRHLGHCQAGSVQVACLTLPASVLSCPA